MKPRQAWIDCAKVISICLVVSYHIPPRPDGILGEFIRLLRMPAFFLIAGYLFDVGKFPSLTGFLRHRSRQLLIPYVTFFILFYALWLCFGRALAGDGEPLWQPLWEFVSGRPSTVVATYWFIACLFVMQVIYWLLGHIVPRRWLFPVSVLLSLVSVLPHMPTVWNVDNALRYLPFYAFANCYKDYVAAVRFRSHGTTVWPMLLVSLLLLTVRQRITAEGLLPDMADHLCYLSAGLMLLPTYICLCKAFGDIIGHRQFIEATGRNTILILACQNYFIGFFKLAADRLSGTSDALSSLPWLNIPLTLVIIAVMYPIALLVERYAPWMAGRPRKNRL